MFFLTKKGGITNVIRKNKKIKERKGYSQEKLARKEDVSMRTINIIEAGKIANPHVDTVTRIAKGLGLELSELLE